MRIEVSRQEVNRPAGAAGPIVFAFDRCVFANWTGFGGHGVIEDELYRGAMPECEGLSEDGVVLMLQLLLATERPVKAFLSHEYGFQSCLTVQPGRYMPEGGVDASDLKWILETNVFRERVDSVHVLSPDFLTSYTGFRCAYALACVRWDALPDDLLARGHVISMDLLSSAGHAPEVIRLSDAPRPSSLDHIYCWELTPVLMDTQMLSGDLRLVPRSIRISADGSELPQLENRRDRSADRAKESRYALMFSDIGAQSLPDIFPD